MYGPTSELSDSVTYGVRSGMDSHTVHPEYPKMEDMAAVKGEDHWADASEEQLEQPPLDVRPKVMASTPSDRHPKAHLQAAAGAAAEATVAEEERAMSDIAGLLKEFLTTQQRREERFLAEVRGLATHLVQGQAEDQQPPHTVPPMSATTAESPRMGLPTPAARRHPADRESGADTFSGAWPVPASQSPQPERVVRKEPKMPIFQQGEDIENYLLRFERMARTWAWPEQDWACRLVPLLTGKALAAYTAMDEEQSNSYKDLREALLEKFDIAPETYRQRFRESYTPQERALLRPTTA